MKVREKDQLAGLDSNFSPALRSLQTLPLLVWVCMSVPTIEILLTCLLFLRMAIPLTNQNASGSLARTIADGYSAPGVALWTTGSVVYLSRACVQHQK